jgi:hypothetical protein
MLDEITAPITGQRRQAAGGRRQAAGQRQINVRVFRFVRF